MGNIINFYIKSTKYSIQTRQTKKNGKVYDLIFRIIDMNTGMEQQKKLSGYPTKAKAKEAYTEFVTTQCQLIKQGDICPTYKETAYVSFVDAARAYMAALHNQNKDSTIYEKHKIFDMWFFPKFMKYYLKDITKDILIKWQDEVWRCKRGKTQHYYSYNYLSKLRALLSAFLSWAEEHYPGQAHNYLSEIRKPKRKAPKTVMQIWTRPQFEQFISEVSEPAFRTFFAIAFFTGRRKGEILALSPSDIDLDKNTIVFSKSITRKTLDGSAYAVTSTKTEIISRSPICKPLRQILEEYGSLHLTDDKSFYLGGEKPLAETSITRVFERATTAAKLPSIRIHDFRHSFVSMCIHLGAPVPVVADLIGDTIEQVTNTYAHMYATDKTQIMDCIK